MKIAIIVPMEEEAEFIKSILSLKLKKFLVQLNLITFQLMENDIYLGLSGSGKVSAAMNLTSLLTKEDIDFGIYDWFGSMIRKCEKKKFNLVEKLKYHDAHCVSAGEYVEGQIPREPARFDLIAPAREVFKKVSFKSKYRL